MDSSNKEIEKYSIFNLNKIGMAITKIMSMIENEKYCLKECKHETYDHICGPYGMDTYNITKNVLLVVKESMANTYYRDYDDSISNNEVLNLVKNGFAIVLSQSDYKISEKIKFFQNQNNDLIDLIDYGSFPYVKEFILKVINYCIQNKVLEITDEELSLIIEEFYVEKENLAKIKFEEFMKRKRKETEEEHQKAIEKHERELAEEKEKRAYKKAEKKLNELLKKGSLSDETDNQLLSRIEMFDLQPLHEIKIKFENELFPAYLTFSNSLISTNNFFIYEVELNSTFTGEFDKYETDPHFMGESTIRLKDHGIIGILDISKTNNIKEILKIFNDESNPMIKITNEWLDTPYKIVDNENKYTIDIIDERYLRIIYLPTNGIYNYVYSNPYTFVIAKNPSETPNEYDYKDSINYQEEFKKMYDYIKKIELLTILDSKQFEIYKIRIKK